MKAETRIELGLPDYEELVEVGRGGFASVYRAWQAPFRRQVAIKVISALPDQESLRRFERECIAIGSLSGHPNIVTVYELGVTTDARPFIVMEYLNSGSLAERVRDGGPMPWAEVVDVGIRLAGAVESAHRAGVLHRDIKPENILTSRFGEPKLGDFGIAHVRGQLETHGGPIAGTFAHVAPELLEGAAPSVASDVYGLASALWTLATGQPAFVRPGETNLAGLLQRILNMPPDAGSSTMPPELCEVLVQGLAKHPTDRQSAAAQLGRQLAAVQAESNLPITRMLFENSDAEAAAVPLPSRASTVVDLRDPPAAVSVRHTITPRSSAEKPKATRRSSREGESITVKLLAVLLAVVSLVALVAWVRVYERRRDNQGHVVFEDNFSNRASHWREETTERSTVGYGTGIYRMVVHAKRTREIANTPDDPGARNLQRLGDVSVRVTAGSEGPKRAARFGLVCRQDAANRRHYEGWVTRDGSWGIDRTENGRSRPLTEGWTPGLALLPGNTFRLRFDCVNTSNAKDAKLELWVDGESVAVARDKAPLPVGRAGLSVRSNEVGDEEVNFDDFELRQF